LSNNNKQNGNIPYQVSKRGNNVKIPLTKNLSQHARKRTAEIHYLKSNQNNQQNNASNQFGWSTHKRFSHQQQQQNMPVC
jgi:hypothetical protein